MLKVLTVTYDGPSPNRKLFERYYHMTTNHEMSPDVNVTSQTIKHFIYSISDVRHLGKAVWNYRIQSVVNYIRIYGIGDYFYSGIILQIYFKKADLLDSIFCQSWHMII